MPLTGASAPTVAAMPRPLNAVAIVGNGKIADQNNSGYM
jgi:hypothetical protein